ncbi:CPA_1a_G0036570.mRNA.1.CDS.1 [Saccharomyces cerevisiae]|nr:CPA_1a_G0036570.mRNA.1.CDS.1 [Saccharomyces cerevisiae]CAI4620063.1 CPI_1c_G0035760.mRNA.1.CDS.1 [Saccharomyces cerevisiae]CAI4628350.1 BBM_1a_G0035920.mRNA.1.CDS.1 [Saccharomyces cerevisiae]CAI4638116.1 ADE_G0035790.mRNA.1.CDS.1 [Saccharomyces cerevisiae]CAI6796974.1 ADE_G0035790.mRNA.1.CDS.1 [Saccharomyces cerevisiae]
MQRVITSCVTGPCKNCYVFLVLGIASWRYIFSYQDGILQSENSKWCSKEKKKKCSAIYPHYNHQDSLGNGAVPRNLLSTYHPMLM